MSAQPPRTPAPVTLPALDWQTRALLLWSAAGLLVGVISGYLYNRSAEEYAERHGDKPPRPGTMELVTLAIAVAAAVRQITELGKPEGK
ncbi:MAG: hypothetical protein ACOYL5_18940 [Phototrophicaceae bacterium]|jgi:hypothetical protein